jgi:hypothetical protein
VVPVVTENRTRNPPPACVGSEGGGGGGCHPEEMRNPTPPTHDWSKGEGASSVASSVLGGCGGVNVMWHIDVARWVLTWGASQVWGLPVSLCMLLARIDTLTSHLDGEEGMQWPSWGGMCFASTLVITIVRCSIVPKY